MTEAELEESTSDDELPPADEQRDDEADDTFGGTEFRGMTAAITHIHGPVSVDGAAIFGVANETAVGSSRATGLVSPETVAHTLRWFVEPAEYDQALALLRTNKIVVLVAPEGTGKRALALRLLRAVCPPEAELVSVSPAASLSQLSKSVRYESGRGYLVVDHIGELAESAQRSYDADRLADKAAEKGAHLVLTTTSTRLGRQLTQYAVTVTAPDPAVLLDRCVGTATVDQEIHEQARRHVARQRRPGEIVRLARRLVDDPCRAAEAMRDQSKELVREWSDGEVVKSDLLSVTTVALAGSQPELVHEELVDALRRHADPLPGEREAAPYVPPEADRIEQRRRDHLLLTSVADGEDDNWLGGRRIRFRNAEMRPAVLAELHQHYGHQLWRPVRAWAHETCAAGPPTDVQVELANGLALLARNDFPYVYQGFLDVWANGVASERTTAAMVLWFMSQDAALSSVALRTAMAWGQGRGPRRAVTSALALGGPLGVRFPGEALQRLCFLALRAKRIGVVARQSVALLFATAVEDGADSTAGVLSTVHAELVRAITGNGTRRRAGANPLATTGPVAADSYVAEQLGASDPPEVADSERETYERGWGYPVAVAARWLVVDVLCAEDPERGDPIAATILSAQPENIELLGRMWTDVLCSAPHSVAARKGLLRLLRALEHDRSATTAVAKLGAAVHAAMPPAHRSLRITELLREADHEAADRRPSTTLVSALLNAIGGPSAHSPRS